MFADIVRVINACIIIIIIIIKQNWNQFLLVVKATALKQQISNFYPQILSTEASFCVYDRPLTEINVIANVCLLNLRIKI